MLGTTKMARQSKLTQQLERLETHAKNNRARVCSILREMKSHSDDDDLEYPNAHLEYQFTSNRLYQLHKRYHIKQWQIERKLKRVKDQLALATSDPTHVSDDDFSSDDENGDSERE